MTYFRNFENSHLADRPVARRKIFSTINLSYDLLHVQILNFSEVLDIHKLCPKHEPFWPKSDDRHTLTLNIS